ncbi:hypothetical protein Pan258_57880 [Symmachiella dynata]|uniref:ArdC-like ssDNA-binding domain-containing protein n=1 Tax=Symmachiella dynata TaxID=2527995 RepID=UPI00118AA5DE|nr:ArdC family protein [Symmachiella dynata]QDT51696.1 hypothetical protein Pan258_57880 [Symmachiella dynata]
MTKFYGKAESAANVILDVFQNPGQLPAALAPIFITRKADIPCRKWSWNNQLITALMGHGDARGFRQWQQVDRHVRKGEKSFTILSPVTKKIKDKQTGEDRIAVIGFKGTAVFGYAQTDGEPLPGEAELNDWLAGLPFREVADSWGLSVEAFNGQGGKALGWFQHSISGEGRAIAVGVENLSTWCHEMIHAADCRLGNLTEQGQHWKSETVAELGGAVLLKVLGYDLDADLGGCWRYIEQYATAAEIEPLAACQKVLKRMCDAVALILDTAEQLAEHNATVCK